MNEHLLFPFNFPQIYLHISISFNDAVLYLQKVLFRYPLEDILHER